MREADTEDDRDAVRRVRDAELALHLASGLSQRAAADRVGCSVATVERRVQDPQFQVLIIEAFRDRKDALIAASVSAALESTTFLLRIVAGQEPEATLSHRIRAAIALRGTGPITYSRYEDGPM